MPSSALARIETAHSSDGPTLPMTVASSAPKELIRSAILYAYDLSMSHHLNAQANPVSNLHVALRRMPLLKSLRMFECRQGIPMGVHRMKIYCILCVLLLTGTFLTGLNRFSLQVESAMFPSGSAPALESYELYLNPDTRIHVSTVVPSAKLLTLRLSGTCQLHEHPPCPSLRHLTITSVKGNYFDTTLLGNMFRGAELSSFAYAHGDRLGFEMRDNQLRSLVLHGGPGAHLQKLVLLSCNRLTTEVLDDVLRQLPHLQHLALSFIVVDELAHNFVLAFPATLSVAKLQITHARYAKPFLEEERMLCEALEEQVLQRHPPPQHVCAAFAPWLLEEGDREFRWIGISECIGFSLTIGAWEQDELV